MKRIIFLLLCLISEGVSYADRKIQEGIGVSDAFQVIKMVVPSKFTEVPPSQFIRDNFETGMYEPFRAALRQEIQLSGLSLDGPLYLHGQFNNAGFPLWKLTVEQNSEIYFYALLRSNFTLELILYELQVKPGKDGWVPQHATLYFSGRIKERGKHIEEEKALLGSVKKILADKGAPLNIAWADRVMYECEIHPSTEGYAKTFMWNYHTLANKKGSTKELELLYHLGYFLFEKGEAGSRDLVFETYTDHYEVIFSEAPMVYQIALFKLLRCLLRRYYGTEFLPTVARLMLNSDEPVSKQWGAVVLKELHFTSDKIEEAFLKALTSEDPEIREIAQKNITEHLK